MFAAQWCVGRLRLRLLVRRQLCVEEDVPTVDAGVVRAVFEKLVEQLRVKQRAVKLLRAVALGGEEAGRVKDVHDRADVARRHLQVLHVLGHELELEREELGLDVVARQADLCQVRHDVLADLDVGQRRRHGRTGRRRAALLREHEREALAEPLVLRQPRHGPRRADAVVVKVDDADLGRDALGALKVPERGRRHAKDVRHKRLEKVDQRWREHWDEHVRPLEREDEVGERLHDRVEHALVLGEEDNFGLDHHQRHDLHDVLDAQVAEKRVERELGRRQALQLRAPELDHERPDAVVDAHRARWRRGDLKQVGDVVLERQRARVKRRQAEQVHEALEERVVQRVLGQDAHALEQVHKLVRLDVKIIRTRRVRHGRVRVGRFDAGRALDRQMLHAVAALRRRLSGRAHGRHVELAHAARRVVAAVRRLAGTRALRCTVVAQHGRLVRG
eukprot:Unigene10592_Nuclearia_a/m.32389 Unigene10592_Nuclearia_a/g.32389  ORF Unigene10592_Nuclearia_a/g.32389 Unigene10592_Nuclearia_a/m.32389 type:complete len:447 (+) Unigene10592_Nuclearia_a:484-1824(+)